ncbi:MAG: gliding motility protein GldL [Prevotellaceae bacterium]|jgi:hypothetical protein|nr:gliding motility protein GldL [Prevotellaceae bacterium]
MAEKKGFGQRLQDFMASYRGKVIMNYAYSWGAAIVIAGTLFKLTHLPGANLMLWVGMGTEVLVFFISAFDLPGKHTAEATVAGAAGGVVVLGGGSGSGTVPQGADVSVLSQGTAAGALSPGNAPAPLYTPDMELTTQAYIDRLKETTEMLARFTAQAESLSHDAEQMSALNRNLSGINAIYEMQLRSASVQIATIDQVHEQTRKMARQIEELNAVYARMLQAVQVKG